MPEFAVAQQNLAAARQAAKDARTVAAQANQRLKGISATPAVESLRQNAADDLKQAREAAQRANDAAQTALKEFEPFSDPRRSVGFLSDKAPFLLFPVRLETRFVITGAGDAAKQQLWVRIYPDDCSINTFEPLLSTAELKNAQRYWQGIWRAGGIEGDERSAWAELVAAHGSGRAGYIVDNYQPANLNQKPVKASSSDVVLVIPTQTALGSAEAAAVADYWRAVWLADNDAGKQQAARDALIAAVGNSRAEQLIAGYQPFNLADKPAPPLTKPDVAISVAYLIFPPDPPTAQTSWTEAPHVAQFPERFVVLGFNDGIQTLAAIGNLVTSPIYVGPDPSADPTVDPTSAIHPDGPDLYIPLQLQWMFDFEQAVAAGMGLAIDLTPEQARTGFDRLLVLGLQLGMTAVEGTAALETLLHHHAVGRSGLSIVPQGTPTHNTSGTGSGYTVLDNSDQSFTDRQHYPLFTITNDPREKRDGQWLGELLGLDPSFFQTVHRADGQDQLQARAMQELLWPATLGYWMDKLLVPVFNDDAIANTRWYFTQYVSGCGSMPAMRIGGQPYGVLPTTAFSRIQWLNAQPEGRMFQSQQSYLQALNNVLRAVDTDWTAMSANSPHLGVPGDAHQQLLDIIGHHPASVEFYSRYAESLSELFNTVNLWGIGPDFIQALLALALHEAAGALIARLGYTGSKQPDIFNHYFLRTAGQITQVIDDRPLSETDPIREYTPDHRNYLQWLLDAANSSLDAVRLESGLTNNATPEALLYLYARHAVMLGYYDTSYELYKSAGILTDTQLAAFKPEAPFVHVAEAASASESRFAVLYKAEPAITGNPNQFLTDYITRNYRFLTAANGLREQLEALTRLVNGSTAQLERAFVEHIDLCSYRFDAWQLGIVNYQLQQMRAEGQERLTGNYLGAYSWLEDLRPAPSRLAPTRLPPDVAKNFLGKTPIYSVSANGGYIHAPSLAQARTAAILRSGYLANATAANPDTLAVNLSSSRVRKALGLLEGIRNGQTLGALLGYQFERGLHDSYALAEVDKFIYPFRKAFPLVADTLDSTKTPPNVPIEAIEARNVLDGRKLIAQINSSGTKTYPFGLTTLPAADAAEQAALNAEANDVLDVYDAIADLALAEGVHQAAQGNFERIAATLDSYSSGNFPPDPQVVQTPSDGIGLTQRVAVQLQTGLPPATAATPRAQAQPALDVWLSKVLPPLDQISCTVKWNDIAGNPQQHVVSCADLGLNPLDLIGLVNPDQSQAMTELDDRVIRAFTAAVGLRPDVVLKINYQSGGKFSVFEAGALVRALAMLIRGSRPLTASDITLSQAATLATNADVFIDRTRISLPKNALDSLGADIDAYLSVLTPLLADPVTNRGTLINNIDAHIDQAIALLERGARFNLPLCGWGFTYDWRYAAVRDLLAQVNDLVTRWKQRLDDFDQRIAAYDGLPVTTSDKDRFSALRAAELVISTQPIPLPATPALLRTALDAKRVAFVTRRDQFAAVLNSNGTTFIEFLNAVDALLPISDFDPTPFDTTAFGDRAITLAEDLAQNLGGHKAELVTRAQNTQAQLNAHDTAATAALQAAALDAAAKALFGDDLRIIPEFGISAAQGAEWNNALAASSAGSLLSFLQTTAQIDFPVTEWLCGVARVRPVMHAWETATALSNAFGQPELQLTPIQLPFEATASWLALQIPPDYQPDSDRLLYTAYYSVPFDPALRQCGLLLDEWTETIPALTHTTGITFNFNRPDNEPPQAILLVTPASAEGVWVWDDLVGALNETLDLAKKRAVEPAQIDSTPYTPLVPATVMAATLYAITISTNLSVANGVMRSPEIANYG